MTDIHPFVSAFTITYQQCDRVVATVRDLLGQQYPDDRYEIVVLDDGSTDGTPEAVRDLAASSPIPLRLLRREHDGDYWNAKRWNECIAAADDSTDVFVQVDDVRLRPSFLEAHVRWHRQSDLYLVSGSKFEGERETWELAACRRRALAAPDGGAARCNYLAIWGASMSYKRQMAAEVFEDPYDRPYDERMVGWGFQETEFAYRMERAGAVLIYDPAAGVFHADHTPTTERPRGLDREEVVRTGFAQNQRYLQEKHNVDHLPWWE